MFSNISSLLVKTAALPRAMASRLLGSNNEEAPLKEPTKMSKDGPFEPTVHDVVRTKKMLRDAKGLPNELVDVIIDAAEYWPHTTQVTRFHNRPSGHHVVQGTGDQDQMLIRCCPLGFSRLPVPEKRWDDFHYDQTKARPLQEEYSKEELQYFVDGPVPEFKHPCRKIVFNIISRDQGWRSDREHRHTYSASYTWFEVGLERFEKKDRCECGCRNDFRAPIDPNDPERPLALPHCNLRPIIPIVEPNTVDEDNAHEPAVDRPPYKFNFPLLPSDELTIQRNKGAFPNNMEYKREWRLTDNTDPKSDRAAQIDSEGRGKATENGEFVRQLQFGDVVTVWGKARFPGWRNIVVKVQVDIYWAI